MLTSILIKFAQRASREDARVDITMTTTEQHVLAPPIDIPHTVNYEGNDTLATILRKMEEMENENKALRNKMREH